MNMWRLVLLGILPIVGQSACGGDARSNAGQGGSSANGGASTAAGGGSSGAGGAVGLGGAATGGAASGGAASGGAGGASAFDGSYECLGTFGSGSCTDPLGEGSSYELILSGGSVTLRFEGAMLPHLTPEFGCTGRWTGAQFDCQSKLNWVRQGRTCFGDLHLLADGANQLTFWTGSADMSQVVSRSTCTK
ncbi:MAG: hypothetical protein ACOY0T_29935 [Myxococcota bacterium]